MHWHAVSNFESHHKNIHDRFTIYHYLIIYHIKLRDPYGKALKRTLCIGELKNLSAKMRCLHNMVD